MCRTRQQIIQEELEVQSLLKLKKDLEEGEINDFSPGRKYFELKKLESQIESTIREFMLFDKMEDVEEKQDISQQGLKNFIKAHEKHHERTPSIPEMFKKSPAGMLFFTGAFLSASAIFYIKEARNALLSLLGFGPLNGETMLVIAFPLFLFFMISGIIAYSSSDPINLKKERQS